MSRSKDLVFCTGLVLLLLYLQVDADCDTNEELVDPADCRDNEITIRSVVPGDKICCNKDDIIGNQTKGDAPVCEENLGFSCVDFNECKNRKILTAGGQKVVQVAPLTNPNIDIRQVSILSTANLCKTDLEVCCEKSDAPVTESVSTKPPDVIYKRRCGRHNPNGLSIRIVESIDGKSTTQPGEWPHMCVVMKKKRGEENEPINTIDLGDGIFLGGASLLAPGIVLTGAHKVFEYEPSDLQVRCGTRDIKNERMGQIIQVKDIVIHPSFNRHNLTQSYNNFALLLMASAFDLNPTLDTICLPKSKNFEEEIDPTNCTATGFGKDSHKGQYQTVMKQVALSIVGNEECGRIYKSRLRKEFSLHESFLCAGGVGDTCEGDGGGPLVCRAKQNAPDGSTRYVQVGITTFGILCQISGVPGVYASVPAGLCAIDWMTKCKTGNKYKDFINVDGCSGWIDTEIERLRDKKANSIGTSNLTPRTGELSDIIDGYLKKAEELKNSCIRS